MEDNLRKHILSNYTTVSNMGMISKTTIDTASNEVSDPDEFRVDCKGPTMLTESGETTDLDELILGNTQINKAIESSDSAFFAFGEPTGLTHAIEDSDPDEFIVSGKTTYETNTIEISDPDEFKMVGITMETRTIETSDPDELYMGPTKQTFTVEASDEDEFLLM